MNTLVFCEFNIDTACVELKYSDGSMMSIDTIAVENEFAETWLDRRELDYLIYNDPWGYADLVLNGDVKTSEYSPTRTVIKKERNVSFHPR